MVLTQPLGYAVNPAGELTGVRIARTELGEPDASGRRRPRPVPGSDGVLAVDLAVEAIGQQAPEDLRAALAGVPFTADGLVQADPATQATGLAGVYAGGDLVNGGATAVRGVAEGMRAAVAIAAALERKS
jgi:glutamate synthase (NADPH/NADH) small chain